METINLSKFGPTLGSRELGRKIRTSALASIQNEGQTVLFNFKGVELLSSAFADELFGKLFIDLGKEQFKNKIKINGFECEKDKRDILVIIQNAFEFRLQEQKDKESRRS